MLPRPRSFASSCPVRSARSARVLLDLTFLRNFSTDPNDKQSSDPIRFPKYNEKTYGADVKKFSQLPFNFGANQHISIDNELKEKLQSVLWKFNAPIRYAFAYGSGVFQQAGANPNAVRSLVRRGTDRRRLWWTLYLVFRIHNIGMI